MTGFTGLQREKHLCRMLRRAASEGDCIAAVSPEQFAELQQLNASVLSGAAQVVYVGLEDLEEISDEPASHRRELAL